MNGTGEAGKKRVAVWDLPTRLFHWILVGLFVAMWITGTNGSMDWHVRLGEIILALLLFRIVWGIIGSRHSRFADFVVGPRAGLAHLREILRVARMGAMGADGKPHAGHTRLGGWMILLLLIFLLAQCVSGLFATDEITTDGPLTHLVDGRTARALTVYHSLAFDVLLALAGIHILAALFYLVRKHENLILPLITGRTELPAEMAARESRFVSAWIALALFAVMMVVAWAITQL